MSLFNSILEALGLISSPNNKINPHAKKMKGDDSDLMPLEFEGLTLAYKYESVNLAMTSMFDIDTSTLYYGMPVVFVHESHNKYDKMAILIEARRKPIGYLYRGTIQDMVHDYVEKDFHFIGYIDGLDDYNEEATIAIGFYNDSGISYVDRANAREKRKKADAIRDAEEAEFLKGNSNIFDDNQFNENELAFFKKLHDDVSKCGKNPALLRINRLSDKTLNVRYISSQIGRIKLHGRKTRMQILTEGEVKWIEDKPLEFYIEQINEWIKYLIQI